MGHQPSRTSAEIKEPEPPVEEKPEAIAVSEEVAEEPELAQVLPQFEVEELKQKILTVLRRESISIAAGLEKAVKWKKEESTITLLFDSPFAGSLVKKEFRTIEKIILNELGWQISFTAAVKKNESHEEKPPEEQVELVRSVFRGTIIKKP